MALLAKSVMVVWTASFSRSVGSLGEGVGFSLRDGGVGFLRGALGFSIGGVGFSVTSGAGGVVSWAGGAGFGVLVPSTIKVVYRSSSTTPLMHFFRPSTLDSLGLE
jgi:hypothetical protein